MFGFKKKKKPLPTELMSEDEIDATVLRIVRAKKRSPKLKILRDIKKEIPKAQHGLIAKSLGRIHKGT
jgi:hypothetical protein